MNYTQFEYGTELTLASSIGMLHLGTFYAPGAVADSPVCSPGHGLQFVRLRRAIPTIHGLAAGRKELISACPGLHKWPMVAAAGDCERLFERGGAPYLWCKD
ncbi:unnamed protein product [Ostreobium quekettii]|uniref:Uncharacterized protein n=1 Tax=Ostreobium quekettii TaxID=121088 RepID=A0A8S1J6W7_9CHLO|nr:unnamed protein product [Ostreobium quekettii]